ncbi:MAG: hypothetical protein HOE90_16260 [Bacteriovoracaceae bacterium]|jgi:hypothetical protein|nr:hypothetical protein [Bacteriovoracaceae bacterium]
MASDIYNKVTNFYSLLLEDNNHRYKSWEHCYSHFMDDDASSNVDISCLHLSFYLASWGMYRGSSFLLWKDYRIHKPVVEKLLKNRHLQNYDFSSIDDTDLKEILDLAKWIKNWYRENINKVNGESKSVNATYTLVTKIMLGTVGCIPAYDRYFIDGMRMSGIKYSKLSQTNLSAVSQFYKNNKAEFIRAQKAIQKKCKVNYPAMKLVDMYFWEIGFQADPNN